MWRLFSLHLLWSHLYRQGIVLYEICSWKPSYLNLLETGEKLLEWRNIEKQTFVVVPLFLNTVLFKVEMRCKVDCISENVVYCITCKLQYIDETGRKFKDRWKEHLSEEKTRVNLLKYTLTTRMHNLSNLEATI